MERPSQIPIATYRLQFNREFTFRKAADIVPYLSALGISHVYASPYLRARPGSIHGYDIIDHNALNPEIGSPEDYEQFVSTLHAHGMGQILDIVPNHMGVMGSDNAWWLDVLENGEASPYAEFFDIDWDPIKDELQGKVLIPILADQYGNVLESGDLKLSFDCARGEFSIFYHEHRFPVDPSEYQRLLSFQVERLQEKLGAAHEDFLELQSIATAFGHLPGRRALTAEKKIERNREKEVQKRRLSALCARSPEIREFLDAVVKTVNGQTSDPASFDNLHELIKAQVYRLAQWRVAADDINYRRFFDINDLAALCMENENVLTSTHRFILELVAQGKVDGLRIDHPDGLYDPTEYFRQLKARLEAELASQRRTAYLVAEKILTGKETLRKDWPVDGTTGYEFANLVNGLFVDPDAARKMELIARSFSDSAENFGSLVYKCKKLILKVVLASELNVLANLLSRIALANRHTCDFTLNSLRSALSEIIASFPVYRTYLNGGEICEAERHYIEHAVSLGQRRSNAADLTVFDFIRRVLLKEVSGQEPAWYRRAIVRFAMKFQQATSAVMAKGLEDTAFYRYHCLISLNEVGGNPGKFGTAVDEFHRANQQRLSDWPHSMLASSTHDSKRSEDVRARINVLSEIPDEWRSQLRRWHSMNRSEKSTIDGEPAPTRSDEYLLYQTLIGMWPGEMGGDAQWLEFSQRIEQYMLKAAREAKEHTSWANINLEYEAALSSFARKLLNWHESQDFLAEFAAFHRRIARAGIFNSLSQCLLKLTAPGVPDIYQGNELYEFSLVDPDNRRPVDYSMRLDLLAELQQEQSGKGPFQAANVKLDGSKAKLFVIWKTLGFRKVREALFREGTYIPLTLTGEQAGHVIAFARERQGQTAIIVVPRLCAGLLGENRETICDESVWGDTLIAIPPRTATCYHDVFTGHCLPVHQTGKDSGLQAARIFRTFPVGLLTSESMSAL